MAPLDGNPAAYETTVRSVYSPPSAEAFWNAAPAERRIMLAELLEHEDKLPLKWHFHDIKTACGTAGCALGSASCVWGEKLSPMIPGVFSTDPLNDPIWNVFGWNHFRLYGGDAMTVTPAMVAAKLRAYQEPR